MTSAPGRQPKTLRPDQRSIAALTRHTAFWWDLWLALAFGIAMGVGGFLDSRFHPSSPYFIGGAAAAVGRTDRGWGTAGAACPGFEAGGARQPIRTGKGP